MENSLIAKLHHDFEALIQIEEDSGLEFWMARDLQPLLEYARWENFIKVIKKAITSCRTSGYNPSDHFLDVAKMVKLGSGAKRQVQDIMLTRYACYLIAQNGDSSKDAIAFAQTYFAVQTRKQEVIAKRITEMERVQARKKLSHSEKELSGLIFEKLHDNLSFGKIRSQGDQALFGGKSTQEMKRKLKVPKNRPLADFLPTITIKAKDFANEISTFNLKRENLKTEDNTEDSITFEHVKNNSDVRQLLSQRKIHPEDLPAEEDVKKVERKLKSEEKKLQKSKNLKIGKSEGHDT